MQPNYVMILSIIWSFILIVLSFYNLYDFILRQENITFELKGKTSSKILMSWRHIRSILDSKKESEVAQSCPTLCDPVDLSLPGSSVQGIFQARILEWVAISFFRRSSQTRDWPRVSCILSRCFTVWATREAKCIGTTAQVTNTIQNNMVAR